MMSAILLTKSLALGWMLKWFGVSGTHCRYNGARVPLSTGVISVEDQVNIQCDAWTHLPARNGSGAPSLAPLVGVGSGIAMPTEWPSFGSWPESGSELPRVPDGEAWPPSQG
jgi:hypothetical protein